jgi:multidrug transporter EmrE-like cation transporter
MGMYLVKMKMNEMGSIEVGSLKVILNYFMMLVKSPLAVIGVILFMVAPLPYAISISRLELSLAYPLSIALSCLIILPLTFIFFGETITFNKITAVVMILISIYFLYK